MKKLQAIALSVKIKKGTQGDGRVAIALAMTVLMLLAAVGLFGLLVAGLFRPGLFDLIGLSTRGKTIPRNQVNPELERRLLMLCNGNKALARRLVAHAQSPTIAKLVV